MRSINDITPPVFQRVHGELTGPLVQRLDNAIHWINQYLVSLTFNHWTVIYPVIGLYAFATTRESIC